MFLKVVCNFNGNFAPFLRGLIAAAHQKRGASASRQADDKAGRYLEVHRRASDIGESETV
jgi:hypothetical protein